MDSNFLLPWEHKVCKECLFQNPHAIWLVKFGCFDHFLHKFRYKTSSVTVVIVHEKIELVRVRPLPDIWLDVDGSFNMCQFGGKCRKGDRCLSPHSKAEKDTWNIKLQILNDDECSEVISDLLECDIPSMSPSKVCLRCYQENYKAGWLSYLKCTQPSMHVNADTITVVTRETNDDQQLVPLRSAQHLGCLSNGKIELCPHKPCHCPKKDKCLLAHSEEELNYWRWEKAKVILYERCTLDEFSELCENYAYPNENSDIITSGVQCRLTCDNYKSKYHKLVFLDDIEHARKLARECDGVATIQVERNNINIIEMKSAAMDYAIQNKASVKFTMNGYNYDGDVICRNVMRNSLIVEIKQNGFFRRFHQGACFKTFIHFNKHWYFWRLHHAIDSMNEHLVERLVLPKHQGVVESRGIVQERLSHQLDQEYQFQALKNMLSCKPGAPYLLIGPFGTGKTHTLAAAVEQLMKERQTQILVCTHQNTEADKIYRSLQKHVNGINRHVLRLVPDAADENRNFALLRPYSCKAVHKVKSEYLAQWKVIVTTFLTALTINDMLIKERETLQFSHIIIDEDAQSIEPEALGALVLADPNTHIIIAGDCLQVGPNIAVYNRVAHDEGLGTSLLERLFKCYKGTPAETSRVSTLLTNYHCHPSILMLASSLFYECTLLSRSDSKALPAAPFPLIFECSSINEDNFANAPTEDRNEGLILVNRMMDFILNDWPMCSKNMSVGLLAATRKQVAYLRQLFHEECQRRKTPHNNLPCYIDIITTFEFMLQGEEFTAVFLSTVEPTNEQGKSQNPARSICNQYVFNTIITRARCLVYAIGNPFLLLNIGNELSVNCWKEYIQRCVTCQTFILPKLKGASSNKQLPKVMSAISKMVLPLQQLNEVASQSNVDEHVNEILKEYMKVFSSRDKKRASFSLVQDPKGMKYWRYEELDSDDLQSEPSSFDDAILKLDSYHNRVVVPKDATQHINNGFQDDVDCILIDKETEKGFNSQHFAASFLCRVNTRNPIEFFPLNTNYPKFINLPTLTKMEREGVVMFDPCSINKCPRMNNFIPIKCAVNMVFVAKLLYWRERFNYPLGIIVGALPYGQSVESGDLLLRMAHRVPLEEQQVQFCKPLSRPHRDDNSSPTLYENAIVIDPEGSHDHDDALTCHRNDSPTLKPNCQKVDYEIGVHITNIVKFVRQGSELDKVAFKRGCSVYRASDCCISNMLPQDLIREASLQQGQTSDSFSVIGRANFNSGVVERFSLIKIEASQVKCECALTYGEAQAELDREGKDNNLHTLWKVASFLRSNRLGEAAFCFIAGDSDEVLHPEAHMLVEEFMIWANHEVASLLMAKFPKKAIFRRQPPPNGSDLDLLIKENGSLLTTSCDLCQYVPHAMSVGEFHILQTVFEKVVGLLKAGKVTEALRYIQFEHLHPQTAVAHSLFNQTCAPSSYFSRAFLPEADDATCFHHSLKLEHYTRFTSPLRRFIDLVIQRFLNAAIKEEECPYQDDEELNKICTEVRDSERRADAYCNDMKNLFLACQLRQNGREHFCFIKKIERGQIQLTFPDNELQSMSKNRISLRSLNTSRRSEIIPTNSTPSLSQMSDSETDCDSVINYRYQWKAKIASATGFPTDFLKHSHLQFVTKQVQDNDSSSIASSEDETYESLGEEKNTKEDSIGSFQEEKGKSYDTHKEGEEKSDFELSIIPGSFAEISFILPVEKQKNVKESRLKDKAVIKPFTSSVSQRNWEKLQKYVQSDPNNIQPHHILHLLDLDKKEDADLLPAGFSYHKCYCPLLIYTIHRPLHSCDVMKVQLTANFNQYTQTLTPSVQLLEVGPGFRVCIQHSSNPIDCFTDRSIERASQYNSITEYFKFWEQVILTEAAAPSLGNCNPLLMIKNVDVQWPAFKMKVDTNGHIYYQLPMSTELLTSKHCVSVTFPKEFAMSSSDSFPFYAGDLVCLRCDREGTNEERDGPVRCVFHMIVHDVNQVEIEEGEKKEIVEINVYLRFVSEKLNYISPQFNRAILSDKHSITFELQLIPLTLPARRVYQSLREIASQQSNRCYTLAQEIALGNARCDNPRPPPVEMKLPAVQAKLATTLWNTRRTTGLNDCQKEAVKLALSNRFVMIHGPPGTKKSVTGAHIAYALAMKLKSETANKRRGSDELSPCVMYCGPSQQSVNSVLKILLSCQEVKDTLNIVRVYSKAIEKSDCHPAGYPGAFHKTRKCDSDYAKFALHHIVRERFPGIKAKEEEFKQWEQHGKTIPSNAEQREFQKLVTKCEINVLKKGVDIVLCTCNEASSTRITSSLKPVYLVVDKCGMSTEPESMVPIRLANNVVLIGDHNQLQPVILNKEAKDMGLGVSLFERYVGVLKSQWRRPHLLQEQYRMLPCLCEFPSREFYDGKLKTSRGVVRRYSNETYHLRNFWPNNDMQFIFCNVVGKEEDHYNTGRDGATAFGIESKINNEEAKKIVQIAKELIENFRVSAAEIAALTPYPVQKEEIKKELQNHDVKGVHVKTITESQGSEFGIVLLSTVRSKNIKDITYGDGRRMKADFGWIKANLGFISDRHQICVGITRCKYGLVIVGNQTLLSYDSTWRKLIDHYRTEGCIVNSDTFPRRVQT